MFLNPSSLRADLRLTSGLVLFAFVLCHFTAHATLLISLPFGQGALRILMAPWQTLAGTAILAGAAVVHYLNALWSIYRRRSLRMSRWEIWQLILGLSIPLLLVLHVIDTRVAELAFGNAPTYASVLVTMWLKRPAIAALQFATVIVVWTHACIGIHFWLRTKSWFPTAVVYLRPIVVLLPALALAGFVSTGNQIRAEAARNPDAIQIVLDDANYTQGSRDKILEIVLAVIAIHLALTLLPFGARKIRSVLRRRLSPPILTHPRGRSLTVLPGASVLETLRDNGIPHAAVCGGRARCTTCRVLVTEGLDDLPPPSPMEARALARINASAETRLACQLHPVADISVVPLLSAEATARDAVRQGGMEGNERPVTVVFLDLRNFTRLSEGRLPYDVLFLLNQFFHEMIKALDTTKGHYSQFTGDGLMALYGLRGDPAEGARNAVRGAEKMLQQLEWLNTQVGSDLREPLRIGIGIHFSEAIVGSMGPPKSQILTAIGDTVNTCARLESLTKDYECSVVMSREVAEVAGIDMDGHALHEASVKGRIAKVQFYALNAVPEII
ncbi:MAG: 2Fe-2S iron-sulfur cluster binding domain-containing protein [Xanthobacteraceae bacterium]|nr:2Fe-2S iron-sulfur cluster binding domain-containing protein [Xanthobacteraceae bacterium]